MTRSKILTRLCALMLCMAQPGVARATEGGQFYGPIGGVDQRAALIPQPGTYGLFQYVHSRSTEYVGPDDKTHPGIPDFKLDFDMPNLSILHVWDRTLWGGNVASILSVSYARSCAAMGAGEVCESSVFDTYVEPLYWGRHLGLKGARPPSSDPATWQLPYGLSLGVGLAFMVPTGSYEVGRITQTSGNALITIPHVDFTYVTGKGTEFSGRISYNISQKNDDAGYKNGDVIGGDFSISQYFGLWQIGPSLTLARQLEDDKSDDPLIAASMLDGNRMTLVQPGLVFTRYFPQKNLVTSLKLVTDLYDENRTKTDYGFVLRVGFKF
jgi:hypothetical protein